MTHSQSFVAVAHRHENIGKDQVRIQIGQAADGGFAIAYGSDFHAALVESKRNHPLNVGIVVGDKNSWHLGPWAAQPVHTRAYSRSL